MNDDEEYLQMPREPISRFVEPIARFFQIEATSGLVLLFCTVIALVLANSDWSEKYSTFWETPIGFNVGSLQLLSSLRHWINDGLMVVFFFVVGLEVKREFVLGELRD